MVAREFIPGEEDELRLGFGVFGPPFPKPFPLKGEKNGKRRFFRGPGKPIGKIAAKVRKKGGKKTSKEPGDLKKRFRAGRGGLWPPKGLKLGPFRGGPKIWGEKGPGAVFGGPQKTPITNPLGPLFHQKPGVWGTHSRERFGRGESQKLRKKPGPLKKTPRKKARHKGETKRP